MEVFVYVEDLGDEVDDRTWGERHRVEEHHKVEEHTLEGHRTVEEHHTVEVHTSGEHHRVEVHTSVKRRMAGDEHRMVEEHTLAGRRRAEVHTLAGHRRAGEHRTVEGGTWAEVVGRSKQAGVPRSIPAEELAGLAVRRVSMLDLTSIQILFHASS